MKGSTYMLDWLDKYYYLQSNNYPLVHWPSNSFSCIWVHWNNSISWKKWNILKCKKLYALCICICKCMSPPRLRHAQRRTIKSGSCSSHSDGPKASNMTMAWAFHGEEMSCLAVSSKSFFLERFQFQKLFLTFFLNDFLGSCWILRHLLRSLSCEGKSLSCSRLIEQPTGKYLSRCQSTKNNQRHVGCCIGCPYIVAAA